MNIAAPPELAMWFTHIRGCADPELRLFVHRDGTPGLACETCGRRVALRANDARRAAAERALGREVEARNAPGPTQARFVVDCIDCGAAIPLWRGDRPVVPLCRRDALRREARRVDRLRRRQYAINNNRQEISQ